MLASDTCAAVDTNVRSLVELRHSVCAIASSFDAAALDGDGAAAALQEWAKISHAADAAMAMAAARLATCDLPRQFGARDASDLVAKATGVTAAKAKEVIDRGGGLAAQELTRIAATSGRLSPAQATAITDALLVNAEAEDVLLQEAARSSVGELRLRCLEKKAEKQDLEAIEKQIHARRCLRRWRDAEGAEHLHATGTKRQMALVDQALKPLVDEQFRSARRDGLREPLEAYALDALVAMATMSIDGVEDEDASGRRGRDPVRSLAVLRVDLPALARGRVDVGETCEIAGLGPISVSVAREMLSESIVKLVLTRGVEVRNVTHLGRGPNIAQKIALLWEQPVCTRQGCGRRARLEYDHIDGFEYRSTRHTRVDELEPLCDPDHDLKTYKGWALVDGTGLRPMVPPDDPRHPHRRATRGP
ncbi:MAG TPA: hypothetical protein VHI95_17660 [Acidimicrobiales bacterium]|nr:hypothetical protein [Acidimicrobiales bacterium]